MFKLVLLSCLLALALAYPHHNAGHHGSTQHDAEAEKPAVPAESAEAEKPAAEEVKVAEEKKPAEEEPAKAAEKEAEPAKAEAKPESDAPKKEEVPAPPVEAHHHADAKPAKS